MSISQQQLPPAMARRLVETCRQAAGRGLMRCSSGNLSMRVDAERLLIKTSRSWMERMTPRDVALCRIADGTLLAGRKPSVEIGFHAGVMRQRPDVNVVMHFQTPCATALACQGRRRLNYFVTPEIPFYIGPIARIPYRTPGSKALADAVMGALRDHDMVVLTNHGLVTVASDADHAIQNAVFFELACEIILRSAGRAVPIPADAVKELIEMRRTARAGV